jgi:hypothetical protein
MDIRNGLITAYAGISASVGASSGISFYKNSGSYFNLFNNGRLWVGSGTPVDAGYTADFAGVIRGVNTVDNADVMLFQGNYGTLSYQARQSSTTYTHWIKVNGGGQQGISNIHIGGGTNTASGSQRNVLVAPGFTNMVTGLGNTAVGYSAGVSLTTGQYNTFIGHSAGNGIGTGTTNIVISSGNGPSYTRTDTFSTIFIGNTDNGGGALDTDRIIVIGGSYFTDMYLGAYRSPYSGFYPNTFTINSAQSITGSTNSPGTALRIASGRGTGNSTASDLIFSTVSTGSSGTIYQTLNDRWYIKGHTGTLTNKSTVLFSGPLWSIDISGTQVLSGSTLITGSLIITGSIFMAPSSSFVLPLTASSSPLTGSA